MIYCKMVQTKLSNLTPIEHTYVLKNIQKSKQFKGSKSFVTNLHNLIDTIHSGELLESIVIDKHK